MNEIKSEKQNAVAVKKQIGSMTYIVKVHFSENATETMAEKIKRMIRTEIQQN